MVTLKRLAQELGLSVATVSRALNGYPEVSEATRQRVAELALSLKYTPNQSAQRLVTGRSRTVVLVMHTRQQMAYYDHHFELIEHLTAAFQNRNLDLFVSLSTATDFLAQYSRLARGGTVDGFVILGPEVDDARIRLLRSLNVPFVVHGRSDAAATYPFYDIDNFGVGYQSTRMLLDLGHRRIALLNFPPRLHFAYERRRGYAQALAEAGIAVDPTLVCDIGFNAGGLDASLGLLLRDAVTRPTAVICGSTLLAHELYARLNEHGLRVPDDVSVIAHDDGLPQCRASDFLPELTVTQAPLHEASAPLADFFCRYAAGEAAEGLHLVREVSIVYRKSVGARRS